MSFWGKLGHVLKAAAPIATAFIPGLGPVASTLLSAGIGAGTGAIDGGGKGALIGGLMGAGTGALGAAGKAGKLGGIGKTIMGGAAGGAAKQGTAGKLLTSLLSGATLATAGKGIGAAANTAAHNRGVALDAMMNADEMRMAQQRERRADESDIMKKMQIAEYLKGAGAEPRKPVMSASGRALPTFDFGMRPSTAAEQSMATELEGQLRNRLSNPMQLSDYASKMNPGKGENILNWLSPILTTVGTARGGEQYVPPGNAPAPNPPASPTSAPVTTQLGTNRRIYSGLFQ